MRFFLLVILSFTSSMTWSADLNWSGLYRVEGIQVEKADLAGDRTSYVLHHFILKPNIQAADDVRIDGKFDILNQPTTNFAYGNQVGEFLGGNPVADPANATNTGNSDTLRESAAPSFVSLSELYMTWSHEFGRFIVGRVPKHFGLGISHNAGKGDFDHWFDNHDAVSYQFHMGNIFARLIYAKKNEGAINSEDDVNEYAAHVGYENPETDLKLGVYYEVKVAADGIEEGAGTTTIFGADPTQTWDAYNHEWWNIFAQGTDGNLEYGIEIAFVKGDSGAFTANNEEVKFEGFGIATEFAYNWNENFEITLHSGLASGDDKNTANKFEGFLFDRNYDVAMLLFNHVLGQGTASLFNTDITDRGDYTNVDTESIGNAVYIAPGAVYRASDTWSFDTRFIYAQLNDDPLGTDVAEDLGFEWDIGVTYKPHDRFLLRGQAAYLFTGDAFKYGSALDQANESTYGLSLKAVVNF